MTMRRNLGGRGRRMNAARPPAIAARFLARLGPAAQGIWATEPGGVSLSGSAIDAYLDLSGHGHDAVAVGAARSTYETSNTAFGGRPVGVFSGAQAHLTDSINLAAYDTLAFLMFGGDASSTNAVIAQRSTSTDLTASDGGFRLSVNDPSQWVLAWSGYDGGYVTVPSQALEAYDLDPPNVITGLWDQTRPIWQVEVRYNVGQASVPNAVGRVDTVGAGGFGSHPLRIGGASAAVSPWTGRFGCALLAAWSGGATASVIEQIVGCEVDAKQHYASAA